MKNKPYWTKNNKTVMKAIKQDESPVSLIALELKELNPELSTKQAELNAVNLISRAILQSR